MQDDGHTGAYYYIQLFLEVLGIKLPISGWHSKCFYPLSHLPTSLYSSLLNDVTQLSLVPSRIQHGVERSQLCKQIHLHHLLICKVCLLFSMIPMISPECKARQICKFHHWHLLIHSSALGFPVTKNLPFIPTLHKTNKLQNLAVHTCFFLNPVSKGVWEKENSHAMTALHTAFVKSGSLESGQHLLFSWAWKHSDFCLFSPYLWTLRSLRCFLDIIPRFHKLQTTAVRAAGAEHYKNRLPAIVSPFPQFLY